jgi:transposase-like protein
MATISPEQKEQVISLVREDKLSNDEIAVRVGVARGTVSAIKAHFTRGSYGTPVATDAETDELIEAAETTFGLERDLQKALRANIDQLERGLRIVDGGKERSTDAGRIDITAQDEAGRMVVIELKAGVAPPEALTQLLAYIGATANETVAVRGILVAEDFHPRVKFGARAVPNVQLRRYRYQFAFEPVD